MGTAKPIDLHVRASQVSHLCFETGGILGELHTELGAQALQFDFATFHAILGLMPTLAGHPARLIYDFLKIQADTQPFALAALRLELSKTALNKAVNARANAFYAKYANAPAIIARMHTDFSPGVADSKPSRLDSLAILSDKQMTLLKQAYLADGRTNVVRNTESHLQSETSSSQGLSTSGFTDDKDVNFDTKASKVDAPKDNVKIVDVTNPSGVPMKESIRMGYDQHHTEGWSRGIDNQTITNTDYGYRVPYLENIAQFERAQISLIDERFAQFMAGQNLQFLAAVFQNELQMIDSDVFRAQIAYLNTILLSPIRGIVTGVYKHPGDPVQPGEPVVRIENNQEILIMATIVFSGPIAVGATLTITTQLFGAVGPPTTIAGPIVSVRGKREDDHWEVIARCSNLDGGGDPIFPFGYHFDFDDTTVVVS
jgi:hypothetical protein